MRDGGEGSDENDRGAILWGGQERVGVEILEGEGETDRWG
jgi:hypothetical protein